MNCGKIVRERKEQVPVGSLWEGGCGRSFWGVPGPTAGSSAHESSLVEELVAPLPAVGHKGRVEVELAGENMLFSLASACAWTAWRGSQRGPSPPDARTAWRGSQGGPSPPAAPEVILPHFTLLLQSLCTQIFGFASGYFIRINDGRHNRRSCYKQFSGLVI